MLNGWMAGAVAAGLLAATAATVYLTNRPQAAPTQVPTVNRQSTPIPRRQRRPLAPKSEHEKRALIAELERDGYRCIRGQLFKKDGNEWKQLGNCPTIR